MNCKTANGAPASCRHAPIAIETLFHSLVADVEIPQHAAGLIVLLLCLLSPVVSFCQAADVVWLRARNAGPVALDFERLVLQSPAGGRIRFEEREFDPAQAVKELRALRLQQSLPPIVIHCSFAEYLRLLKDPAVRTLLAEMKLDLLNPRLLGFPFYLLQARSATVASESLEVAWITPVESELHPVEEADLLTMLSESLGRPKSALKVTRERGAYPAARKLYEGTYGLVGVYDEEPSALLDEFRVNWTQELRAGSLQFYRFEETRADTQLVSVAAGRFSYMFFTYRGVPFPGTPEAAFILAVTHEMTHDFPVVLSNAGRLPVGDLLLQSLGTAYFLMPAASAMKGESPMDRRRVEHVYLLNSYLADPSSRVRGLALLGSLLMKQETVNSKLRKEIYREKCSLFQQKLGLSGTDVRQILEWIDIRTPAAGRRESFSNDVSRLYEDAVRQIEEALSRTGSERRSLLEKAGSGLVAALRIGGRPKNVQGSRGLWSVADYNPYYQLARVAFYLEEDSGRRP